MLGTTVRLDKATFDKLPQRMRASLVRKYPEETRRFLTKEQSRIKCSKKVSDDVKYSPWPTKNPAHKLHQQLVENFGDYFRHPGGNIIHEVLLENAPKKWRYDHCFVTARILIEFNGWQNHHLLHAFQNDHEKRAFALTQGFVVYNVTNKMVRETPDLITKQLKLIASQRREYHDVVERVGNSYCKIIS